jgi:hypothetical protein
MHNVPQIVRQRLEAAPSPAIHPDADLLTAFAEQSLPGSERAVVLDHLARCGDCREVVALALPPSKSATLTLAASAGRTNWFSIPVMRWGVVAAGLVVVTSVGVLQYRQRQRATTAVASQVASYKTDRAQSARPAATVSQPLKLNQTPAEPASQAPSNLTAPTSSGPAPAHPIVGGVIAGETRRTVPTKPLTTGSGQQVDMVMNAPARNTAAAPAEKNEAGKSDKKAMWSASPTPGVQSVHGAAPAAPETVAVQSNAQSAAAEQVQAQAQATNNLQDQDQYQSQSRDQIAQNQDEAPQALELKDSGGASRAKSAVTPNTAAGTSAVSAPDGRPSPGLTMAYAGSPVPRWTISSSGDLQRSFDGGRTWQDVHVDSASGAISGLPQHAVVAKDAAVYKQKLRKEASPSPVFRVVSTTGADVWAGGSGGALFHSVDAGAQWMRIVPEASGVSLTGDVTTIEFADAKHGKITTSTAELWMTGDGGLTWQKSTL